MTLVCDGACKHVHEAGLGCEGGHHIAKCCLETSNRSVKRRTLRERKGGGGVANSTNTSTTLSLSCQCSVSSLIDGPELFLSLGRRFRRFLSLCESRNVWDHCSLPTQIPTGGFFLAISLKGRPWLSLYSVVNLSSENARLLLGYIAQSFRKASLTRLKMFFVDFNNAGWCLVSRLPFPSLPRISSYAMRRLMVQGIRGRADVLGNQSRSHFLMFTNGVQCGPLARPPDPSHFNRRVARPLQL